jgi:predicted nucleotidyltransferase
LSQPNDLIKLASILADWVSPAPSLTIYLYGSRVRGDHRPDSDVDVVIDLWNGSTTEDGAWWHANNADDFSAINARVRGRLEVLEIDDPLRFAIIASPVVHRDRQVVCVWKEPKPSHLPHTGQSKL